MVPSSGWGFRAGPLSAMRSDPSAAEMHGRDLPAGAVVFEEGAP